MITLETLVPYATSLMKGQKLNVYLLNCIRVAKLELHVFLEFHIIIPQGRNSWDTWMCECWCTQVRFAWAPRTAASEVDKSLANPVLSLSYLHTHTHVTKETQYYLYSQLCLHVTFVHTYYATCLLCSPHVICLFQPYSTYTKPTRTCFIPTYTCYLLCVT